VFLMPKPEDDERLWIAHFGGSFNPVHAGHIAIGRTLLDECGFDRVVYVPTSGHYPKDGLAPERDRLALLRTAIAGERRFEACAYELGKDDWTEPVETIRFLKSRFEQHGDKVRIFTVRGGDWWQEMKRWQELEDHEGIYEFIVVPRAGAHVESMSTGDSPLAPLVCRSHVLPCRASVDVSSSLVRRLIGEGITNALPVPPGVDREIRRRGLYGIKEKPDQ
jgi:nicotinate-nucleotide adenylyltransferase